MLPPFFNGDEDYAYPDGFDSYEDYEDAGKIPNDEYIMDYEQWRVSLGMSTGYRWPLVLGEFTLGSLSLSGGLRFGVVNNNYDGEAFRPFDPTIRNRNNQWTPANSVWTALSLDKRDIFYDPTKGFYLIERLSLYGLLPIEPEHYTKSDTKAELFFTPVDIPVGEEWAFRMTFAFHSGLSFLLPTFGMDRPVVENANKLAIDGMFNARGWHSEYSNKGFAMWENWAELRIPLVMRVLALDFFFDAAMVSSDWNKFWSGDDLSKNMRFSFGLGPRFTIPQFPLRLLFAWRFTTDGMVTKGAPDVVLSFALSSY
jgi:outer membrane protein insertion porin family